MVGMLLTALVVLGGCSFFDHKHDYALAHDNTLSVVVSVDGAPLVSRDATHNNELIGYSVAVAQEVAQRLGLGCSVEAGDIHTMSERVKQGSYDVALSLSSTVTDQDGLVSSNAYYIDSQVLVVRDTASFDQVADLEKKIISAVAKTEGSAYARSAFDEDNVLVYATVDRCFEALQRGQAQAVVLDRSVAEAYLRRHDGLYTVLERIETGQRYGFMLSSDNEVLLTAINDALQAMDKDGTLQRLQEEYLHYS